MAGMNGLDYVILAIVGIGAFNGMMRGALRMATSILSLVLGVYAAATYYGRAAALAHRYLSVNPPVDAIIGWLAVFAIVFMAVSYAGVTLVRLVQAVNLNWIDRLAGGVLGASIGAVVAGFAVLGTTAILPPNPELLRNSRLAPQILSYNQVLMAYVPPEVKKSYEAKRAELYRRWVLKEGGATNDESPDSSPSPTN